MILKTVRGKTPIYGANCFFSETSVVIGDVVMGRDCSVWYHAVIRGDVHRIRIGDRVNIQDGAVIHATYERSPTTIGNRVSIVMDDCVVESNSIIAAGAVLTQGTHVPSGTIYGGVPAKKIKDISAELLEGEIERIADNYTMYAGWFTE